MNVSIISIGDELLIGQTVNTNAAWLGKELSLLGMRIQEVITIADDEQTIINTLNQINASLCIITGGLGPTKDDRTKKVLAQYFNMPLKQHEPTLKHIEAFFKRRNRPMLQTNIDQALLPDGCEILPNSIGTAAGMWFEGNGKSIISLPGVPYEMKGIFLEEILPRIKSRFELNSLYYQTVITHGIGESFLAEMISEWENSLEKLQLTLAYLPSPGMVKLRIGSYRGKTDEPIIQDRINVLKAIIPNYIIGFGEDTLLSVTSALLIQKKVSLGTVESCTAGKLASTIISVPGSSQYFKGSLLTYQTKMKTEILGIAKEFIEENDVVSEAVVKRMAEEGKKRLGVDYCISTTGVMGPGAGDSQQSVGTIWIGIAGPKDTFAVNFTFGDNRERNIEMGVLAALNALRKCLI